MGNNHSEEDVDSEKAKNEDGKDEMEGDKKPKQHYKLPPFIPLTNNGDEQEVIRIPKRQKVENKDFKLDEVMFQCYEFRDSSNIFLVS